MIKAIHNLNENDTTQFTRSMSNYIKQFISAKLEFRRESVKVKLTNKGNVVSSKILISFPYFRRLITDLNYAIKNYPEIKDEVANIKSSLGSIPEAREKTVKGIMKELLKDKELKSKFKVKSFKIIKAKSKQVKFDVPEDTELAYLFKIDFYLETTLESPAPTESDTQPTTPSDNSDPSMDNTDMSSEYDAELEESLIFREHYFNLTKKEIRKIEEDVSELAQEIILDEHHVDCNLRDIKYNGFKMELKVGEPDRQYLSESTEVANRFIESCNTANEEIKNNLDYILNEVLYKYNLKYVSVETDKDLREDFTKESIYSVLNFFVRVD